MQLGRKIRDLRLRRGLTVQQLAEATGLSKGFVSQVENGRTSPSLSTLQELAKSLETSVAYLVVEEDQVPYVVRRHERPNMSVNGNGSRVEVMSAQPRRNLELLQAELPPGVSMSDKRQFHHGEEVILCVEGRIRLACGEHVVELEAGDSCHFDGRVPHSIENVGERAARLFIALTPTSSEPVMRTRGELTNGHTVDSAMLDWVG
jgi:transcriptional regulator with XRE-family HTH domain